MARSALGILIGARGRAVRNIVLHWRQESRLKIAVVVCAGLAMWVMLFGLFNEGFRFLNTHAFVFREALLQHVFSLFFLSLLTMLIFSNALISFNNLFRSPETTFLFALPIRPDTLYLYKLLESLAFSSWAVLALGLPLLLSYGIQSRVPWTFYPALLAFFAPYVVLPAGLGVLLGLVLTAAVPRHRGKMLALLGALATGAAVWLIIEFLRARAHLPGGTWQRAMPADVDVILQRLNFTQNVLTPNFWMTQGLLAAGEGGAEGWRPALAYFAALATSAVFCVVLGWFIARPLYARTYSKAAAASSGRRRAGRSWGEWLAAPLLRRYPVVTVLVLKDLKTFLRDPVQWSQVLIFFGLLTVYIANLRNLNYRVDETFYQNLISFLNLGATSLTLATLVSRFVFPLISLEGRRFWVLGLAPVERRRILQAKFVFSLGGALLVTEALVLLSNYVLRGTAILLVAQMITAALLCLGLTGLGVGMGALFPSLRETNPSKIVSGFGGTLNLILSIGLVLLVVMLEGAVCHRFLVIRGALAPGSPYFGDFVQWLTVALVASAALCVVAAWVPMHLGQRALEKMEF